MVAELNANRIQKGEMATENMEGKDGRRQSESICATLRRSRLIVCDFQYI